MSQHRTSFVDRIRRRSSGHYSKRGRFSRLHSSLLTEFERNVTRGCAPNELQVWLHPNDYARLAPAIPALRKEMLEALNARCAEGGYEVPRTLRLNFLPEPSMPLDAERVKVNFTYDPHARDAARDSVTAAQEPGGQLPAINAVPPLDTADSVPLAGDPAPGAPQSTQLALIHLPGGPAVPVRKLPFTIGRSAGNDLPLGSYAVSRRHAEIVASGDATILRDLGSRNGLIVSGQHVDEVRIVDGIVVTIGDIDLHFDLQHA